MTKEKVVVFVPHPDDEINVAGSLIYDLRNKKEIYVVFSTNGDYKKDDGIIRIKEALNSLKKLGVKEDNIIFLGYADGWKGTTHIYNGKENQCFVSMSGYTKTYALDNHAEYCYVRDGVHKNYTRKNFKEDITNIIVDLHPDIIISVDFDRHPDHRALSLMVEEALGEVLKCNAEYRPIVLKKYAYASMYKGEKDYNIRPLKETQRPRKIFLLDEAYELDSPSFTWNDRLRFDVSLRCRTNSIKNNKLYEAAKCHQSQGFEKYVPAIANADIVYWQRRTDNLSFEAKIDVSSGEKSYLSDFKLYDCSNIWEQMGGYSIFNAGIWIPQKDDEEKRITFVFDEPRTIRQLCLYENCSLVNNILEARIVFNEKNVLYCNKFNHQGGKTVISVELKEQISKIDFFVEKYEGEFAGITEFEIYGETNASKVNIKPFKQKRKGVIHRQISGLINDNHYIWMENVIQKWKLLNSETIIDYLTKNNIKNIAIYGLGEVGLRVVEKLYKADISIVCAVDRRADKFSMPFKLYKSVESIELTDIDIFIFTIDMSNYNQEIYNKYKNSLIMVGIEDFIEKINDRRK